MTRTLVALALLASSLGRAYAGIGNSPIPAPFTQHVFSVAGVISNDSFSAYFSCTNAGSQSVTVGIELFGPAGGAPINTAATTAISLAPGATAIFGTTSSASFIVDGILGTGTVTKGSARILATSKKLICAAFLADPDSVPPVSTVSLAIVPKQQKASN
jgi:hypothetical protein